MPAPSRLPTNLQTLPTETPCQAERCTCHIPAGASKESAEFLSRTAADDAPPASASNLSEDFRHSGWAPFRRRVEQALMATAGVKPRRLAAFRLCGSDAYVEARPRVVNAGGFIGLGTFGHDYRIRQTKCHDRFCVPCSRERSNRIRHALLQHMQKLPDLKLITLTLRNVKTSLTAALDRITKHFRTLRSKSIWSKRVQGGVWIIETKIGENSGEWHVHVHCVAQAKFIPQHLLSELWHNITGDSFIVDIRPVGARTGAVSYITKYVTKASDHQIVMDPERLQEAIIAFTGRRLVSTFGAWRGLELMEKPCHDPETITDEETGKTYNAPTWRPIGSLSAILASAAAGDPQSRLIISRLTRKSRPPPPSDMRQLPPV